MPPPPSTSARACLHGYRRIPRCRGEAGGRLEFFQRHRIYKKKRIIEKVNILLLRGWGCAVWARWLVSDEHVTRRYKYVGAMT